MALILLYSVNLFDIIALEKNVSVIDMSDSDKITEPNTKLILEAINELSKKIDGLEIKVDGLEKDFREFKKTSNAQFEAIRQGISANSAAFDRLEAKFHENRTDILNFRADMKDMHEDIRRWKKESAKETLELK